MAEPVTAKDSTTLPSLTSLRWYAALSIFLLHELSHLSWRPLKPFGVGYVGVTFFFVLSGFVLTWSAPQVIEVGRFYRRRFARIYPLHLVCLTLTLIGGLFSTLIANLDPLAGLFSLTLTQSWWPAYRMVIPWNTVSWSLAAEAFFYLCFPFVLSGLRNRKQFGIVVALGLLSGLTAMLALRHWFGSQGAATAYFNPAARFPEFLVGIWLAVQVKDRGRRVLLPLWAPVLAVAVSAVIGWRILLPLYPLANYVMIPSLALLVVVAAQRDADGGTGRLERLLRNPLSVYLGELSFAFYLVHSLVITCVFDLLGWHRSWSLLGGLEPTVVTLGAALLAAVLLHHGVEVPARRMLLRPSRRRLPGHDGLARAQDRADRTTTWPSPVRAPSSSPSTTP